jgi:tetratricopeptide (TPR) repeat protein
MKAAERGVILTNAKDLFAPTAILRSFRALRMTVLLTVAAASTAHAQSGAGRRADSVFVRARQLVVNGNGAAGRVLIDSVVATTERDTPAYAEALFWRASLAAASADAERDYRRIIVEYPLSPRASDALLQLGQLEAARGDRVAAASHLDRYLADNPKGADRARIGLQLVRLSFEQNDLQRGCIALARALGDVPAGAVEMRNQLDYYSPRCAGVDTTHAAAVVAPTAVKADSARETHATRDIAGRFTLQVAAYTSRADADGLAKRLKKRGLDARVAGTTKLFRVRVGRYPTRAAAAAAAKELKAKKIDAFVTDIGADDK